MIVCGSRSLTFSPLGFECGLASEQGPGASGTGAGGGGGGDANAEDGSKCRSNHGDSSLHNVTEGEGRCMCASKVMCAPREKGVSLSCACCTIGSERALSEEGMFYELP